MILQKDCCEVLEINVVQIGSKCYLYGMLKSMIRYEEHISLEKIIKKS